MSRPSTAPPNIPGHEYVDFVASGGFGDVFVYRDNIGRDVAIKVLHRSGLTEQAKSAFQVEAARMARIRNRFVVTVYGFGISDDGRPYISMEHCPSDLGAMVRREQLSVSDALRVAIQISSAVAAAHREGLFHRDIKPANVLLTHDGTPALTDFGIAGGREAGGEGPRGLSLRYAPPEVIEGVTDGEEVADTYALAALTFTMLAGHAPYHVPGGDNSEAALIDRTLSGRLTSTGRVDIPGSLERVLSHALATDPSSRFASAVAFARALQEVELELGFGETTVPLGDVRPDTPDEPDDDPDDGTRFARPRRVDPSGRNGAQSSAAETASEASTDPDGIIGAVPQQAPDTGTQERQRSGARAGDHTQLRGRPGARRSAAAAPDAPVEGADDPAPAPPRPSPAIWARPATLVASVGVLVAIGVGLAFLGTGVSAPEEQPAQAEQAGTNPAGDAMFAHPSVPQTVRVERADDGVAVTWEEDDLDDVSYLVTVTGGPRAGDSFPTPEPEIDLEDPDPDTQVCVRVLAVLGSTSTEPSQEVCTR